MANFRVIARAEFRCDVEAEDEEEAIGKGAILMEELNTTLDRTTLFNWSAIES